MGVITDSYKLVQGIAGGLWNDGCYYRVVMIFVVDYLHGIDRNVPRS